MFSLLSLFLKKFYGFDETKSTVALNLLSALKKTMFDKHEVRIFILKFYKFSPLCTFDSTRFVQLVDLHGMQKL